MAGFVDWVCEHALPLIVIVGTAYAVWYVLAHRKHLFYKE